MEKSCTQVLEMEVRPGEPTIDELWLEYAAGILHTVPQTAERAAAEQKYVVSLLAKIESEAFLYPQTPTAAERAKRLNALACQGIWQAAEPYDIEPTTYLFKDPTAWQHYLASTIFSKAHYTGAAPQSNIDFLYRLADGTAWFVDAA